MILHPELIKKYFSHPRQLLMVCKEHLADACKVLEEDNEYGYSASRLSKSDEMDYNFHLAKICCILSDYFKTEGLVS